MSDNTNKIKEEKKVKEIGSCGISLALFIVLSAIAVTIILFAFGIISPNNSDGNGPFSKEKPAVSVEQTLTGLNINIQCNDNYDYVILKIDLFDKNYNIVKSFTLRENTMKKGELRQVEYKLSLEEAFSAKQVRATVQEFK